MKKFILSFALSCLVFSVAANGVFAQSYPNKPIRIIVPYSPGGANDIRARLIAEKLTKSLGQQVVVENKPGADGAIAVEMVAKAAPDGYTLLAGATSPVIITACLYKKVRFDPVKDFEPITQMSYVPTVFFVNPSLPVRSMQELVALAKSKPGQLNYGSPAAMVYIVMELFKLRTGVNIVHIPYKGSAPTMNALISGEVSMTMDIPIAHLAHVKAGTIRAIAIVCAKRSPAMPDVPTMSESGFPGFEIISWSGVLAPAGTPKEIIKRLNTEIVGILHMPDIQNRLSNMGDEIVGSTPEEFAAQIKADFEKYTKGIKDAGIPRIE